MPITRISNISSSVNPVIRNGAIQLYNLKGPTVPGYVANSSGIAGQIELFGTNAHAVFAVLVA
jgi:hypothetical protein